MFLDEYFSIFAKICYNYKQQFIDFPKNNGSLSVGFVRVFLLKFLPLVSNFGHLNQKTPNALFIALFADTLEV